MTEKICQHALKAIRVYMEKLIDLHTHSTASDGTDSPSQLIEKAKQAGLSAVALTDHDNTFGHAEAKKKADEVGIELIKGIEISTSYTKGEVHILGYWFNSEPSEDPNFIKTFTKLLDYRNTRNEKQFKKLAALNIHLSMDDVKEFMGNQILTRPHFALAMQKKGYVKDVYEAFKKYLGYSGVAYIEKERLTQREAIEILRETNAVTAFAHPYLTPCPDEDSRKQLIKNMTDYGLQAIETFYSTNSPKQTKQTKRYAKDFGLVCTGGSDYHGRVKPDIKLGTGKGKLQIPYSVLEELRAL